MPNATNIRVLVPRVRRAVEGAGAPAVLSDDAIKDLVADSIAAVMLYSGSVFGKTLDVAEVDGNGAPEEYTTSDPFTLQEQVVIANQAALDYFFFQFVGFKTSERIADEAGAWEWTTSAGVLKAQLDLLVSERDKALAAIEATEGPLESYESFIAVRDVATARMIEPWVDGSGIGGFLTSGGVVLEEDFRFGGIG